MIDERVRNHLHADADALHLPEGDLDAVAGRAARRRRNRHALFSAALVVAVGASGVAVLGSGDQAGQTVAQQPPAAGQVVESPLEWHPVDGGTDVGQTFRSVTTGDGQTFGITGDGEGRSLVRSTDGVAWDEVALPDELPRANALTAAGNTLYATGTSPDGGGGSEVTVARTDDGGATWQTDTVSLGLDDLRSRFPDQLVVGTAKTARGPNGLVGAVRVWAQPDLDALLPDGVDVDQAYAFYTDDGAEVHLDATSGETSPEGEESAPDPHPEPAARYSWDELDLDPELRRFVDQDILYTFALDDDGEEVVAEELPLEGYVGDSIEMVADDAGYHLVLGYQLDERSSPVRVLTSADGRAWSESDLAEGHLVGAGVLDGRAAIAVRQDPGRGDARMTLLLFTAEPGGAWSSVDLVDAAASDVPANLTNVAFGPLGVAVGIEVYDGPEAATSSPHVVHSADGRTVSVVAVGDHLGEDVGRLFPVNVTVTADAITAGFTGENGNGSAERFLVGTPAG